MTSEDDLKKAEEERLRRIVALLNLHCNGSFYAIDGLIHKLHGFGRINEADAVQILRERVAAYDVQRKYIEQGIAELTLFLKGWSEQGARK